MRREEIAELLARAAGGDRAGSLEELADRAAEAKLRLSATEAEAATASLVGVLDAILDAAPLDLYALATIFAAAAGLGLDAAPIVEAWLAKPGAEAAITDVFATPWITRDGDPGNLEEQIGRLVPRPDASPARAHVDPQRALVRALCTERVRAFVEERRLATPDPDARELLAAVEDRIAAERKRS